MKSYLAQALHNPLVSRALHSFWQGALVYAFATVNFQHVSFNSVGDWKVLLAGILTAGLSALKTTLVTAYSSSQA